MNIDEIITLEDNSEYVLILASLYEGAKYFLASKIENNNPTENYTIFKEIMEPDGSYSVEEVEDSAIKEALVDEFENQIDTLDEMESQQ